MKYEHKYLCKENDNFIAACFIEGVQGYDENIGELDEIHIGCDDLPSHGATVIGIADLKEALNMFGYDLVRIDNHQCKE